MLNTTLLNPESLHNPVNFHLSAIEAEEHRYTEELEIRAELAQLKAVADSYVNLMEHSDRFYELQALLERKNKDV